METTDYDEILAMLTPMASVVPDLAHEIERARIEAGITTEEMLEGLRRQRQRYYEENYAATELRQAGTAAGT